MEVIKFGFALKHRPFYLGEGIKRDEADMVDIKFARPPARLRYSGGDDTVGRGLVMQHRPSLLLRTASITKQEARRTKEG